jgi:hypothetical protein
MTKKSNIVKFKTNEHLMRLIKQGAESYNYTENEYVGFVIKKSLYEFEQRIEHENPSKVLLHYKDAMNFFQLKDEFCTVDLERQAALNLKMTSNEYERDLLEFTTMFVCYSILRD